MRRGIIENVLGGQILMQRMTRNEETLRNLRSEYMGKYTRLLHTGKRGEIEQLLDRNSLELEAPVTPPSRIKMEED